MFIHESRAALVGNPFLPNPCRLRRAFLLCVANALLFSFRLMNVLNGNDTCFEYHKWPSAVPDRQHIVYHLKADQSKADGVPRA
jgi:hypothetical protein